MATMPASQRTATAGRPISPTKPAAKMKKQLAPGLCGAVTRPMATIARATGSERPALEPEAAEVEDEEQRPAPARRSAQSRRAVGQDRVDDEEGEVDEPGVRRPSERRRFG